MFFCDKQISIAFFLQRRIDPVNRPLISQANSEQIIFIMLYIAS